MRFNTIPKIDASEWVIIKIRMNTAKMIKVKQFDKSSIIDKSSNAYNDVDSLS